MRRSLRFVWVIAAAFRVVTAVACGDSTASEATRAVAVASSVPRMLVAHTPSGPWLWLARSDGASTRLVVTVTAPNGRRWTTHVRATGRGWVSGREAGATMLRPGAWRAAWRLAPSSTDPTQWDLRVAPVGVPQQWTTFQLGAPSGGAHGSGGRLAPGGSDAVDAGRACTATFCPMRPAPAPVPRPSRIERWRQSVAGVFRH